MGRFMPVLGVGWYTDSLPRAGVAPVPAAALGCSTAPASLTLLTGLVASLLSPSC